VIFRLSGTLGCWAIAQWVTLFRVSTAFFFADLIRSSPT
jgi:hypothetical protein